MFTFCTIYNIFFSDPNALNDDIKITWRGDGELYAVGFTMDGIRRFKVFDKDGHLQYTSEKQPGLETNLSWRPSGNLIATTQKLQDKYCVAFFEKNGLKHGGFDIPVDNNTSVQDISWSSDSEIIALQCHNSIDRKQKILLFTSSNYHWYLKQVIYYNSDQKINTLLWHNDFDVANSKKLHIILEDGKHFSYTWIWNVDHSVGKGHDDAIVAVIDGSKILLTGFRQTVVPPPMASLELNVGVNVNSVQFYKSESPDSNLDSNTFFVVTENNNLIFYRQTIKSPLSYEIFHTSSIGQLKYPFEKYHWQWIGERLVTCIHCEHGCYNLLKYEVDFENGIFDLKQSLTLPDAVMRCHLHPKNPYELFVHFNNGEIIGYNMESEIIPMDTSICLPIPCPRFSILVLDDELVFISLSHKGNLYYNDNLIMNNVSSYFIHTYFLLLTTLQHVLLCTEITKSGIQAIIDYQKTESPHVYKRKIERGAKLVIAVPNDTRTVFQMPRGNIETIQPRPLSLKIIGEYIDLLKYNEAFDIMRKQRINLNLIYDHNPNKFINNIDIFLENIKNNSWLNLFLADLENIDVTKTMYSSSYAERNNISKQQDDKDKVTKICDLIRINIDKRPDRDSKILPLLTTYVKKNTVIDLENALAIIKQLKLQESLGSKLPVGSDEALKYLLYMVDVTNLFDVALGMYDFDLVLFVASKSQKDPKEYVAMLQEWTDMDEDYKRFTVNKHLKRFDRAVECLAKCGPDKYDELKNFVKYHSLYRKALDLFTPADDIFKQISNDFGLHLKLKKQFVEAGSVYRRAGSFDKAIECFKEALEWELAIELAHTLPKEHFDELCL